MLRNRGFAPVIILIIIAVIGIIGYLGYKNLKVTVVNSSPSPISLATQTPSASPTPSPKNVTKPIQTAKPTTAPTTKPTDTPTLNVTVTSQPTNRPAATSTPTPQATSNVTPTVRVTYPNGGETFTEGDNMTITWDATGTFSSFVLMYSSCPSCADNIATVNGNARSYTWNKISVGNTTNTNFKIWIVSYPSTYSGPNPTDYSDNNFTVIQNPACDSGCP